MDTPVGELLARRRDKGAPNGLEAPAPAGTVRSPPASPPSPRVVLSGGSTAGARALDDEPNFYDIGTATPGLTGKGVVLRSTPASVYRRRVIGFGCLGLLVVITTGATIIALGSGSASSSSTVPPHLPSPLPPPSPTPSLLLPPPALPLAPSPPPSPPPPHPPQSFATTTTVAIDVTAVDLSTLQVSSLISSVAATATAAASSTDTVVVEVVQTSTVARTLPAGKTAD